MDFLLSRKGNAGFVQDLKVKELQRRGKYAWMGDCRCLLYILLLLPVFLHRDFTPANELKYISIVDEALQNGSWFTFYNHGEVYADKPPLFFWFTMLSKILTGGYHMEVIGLFSLLPAMGVLIVMNEWLREEHIAFNPVVAELLLLTTAIFMGASLIVRMDMLMTFFIVLSLYTFFRMYKGKHVAAGKYVLPVYIFLAVFSKGAMGFVIPLVSILAFLLVKGQLKTVSRYLGWRQWAIMIALFTLWFICVYVEGGALYLNNLLFKQTVGRGINSFDHKGPFSFYISRMLMTFAPWSLLYITLIGMGIKKRIIKGDVRLFFSVVAIANIVVLSLISAKLDVYMLPLYPFIIYLCASLLPHFKGAFLPKIAVAIPVGIAILALPVSFFVVDNIPYTYDDLSMVRLGLFFVSVAGVISLYMLRYNHIQRAIASLSFGILVLVFFASFALPQFNKYLGFKEMAVEAHRVAKCEGVSQFVYYKFPTASNMDVYLGEKVRKITSVSELDALQRTGEKSILFVRETEIRRDPDFARFLENRQVIWHTGRYRWYFLN